MKPPAANHQRPSPLWLRRQTAQIAPVQAKISGLSGVGPSPKAS